MRNNRDKDKTVILREVKSFQAAKINKKRRGASPEPTLAGGPTPGRVSPSSPTHPHSRPLRLICIIMGIIIGIIIIGIIIGMTVIGVIGIIIITGILITGIIIL